MKARRCQQLWRAEALDDGRLTGVDRESFERHCHTCSECREEIAALRELRKKLGVELVSESPELVKQRQRADLLHRANERLLGRSPRRSVVLGAAMAFAAALVVAFVVFQRTSSAPALSPPPVTALVAPRFDVESSADAVWKPSTEAGTTRIALAHGRVSFSVPHLEKYQRFIVSLPDAEVEVRGTRFTILVEGGRTRSVSVTEGRVAFLRPATHELLLGPGDSWRAPAENSDGGAELAEARTEGSAAPGSSSSEGEREIQPKADTKPRPTGSASPTGTTDMEAGRAFAAAMREFQDGRLHDADAALSKFVHQFPHDSRAEDAAYLRCVVHRRLGDEAGAAALAHAYLASYPSGLRRREAESILRSLPDAGPTQTPE